MAPVEWVEIARRGRNHAVLSMDLAAGGIAAGYADELFGRKIGITHWRQFDGARWMSDDSIRSWISEMEAGLAKDEKYLLKVGGKGHDWIEKMVGITDSISKKNYFGKKRELIADYEQLAQSYMRMIATAYGYITINRFYPERVMEIIAKREHNPSRQAELAGKLLALRKKPRIRQERESLIGIAKALEAGDENVDLLVTNHVNKFAFLGKYVFYGRAYDHKTVLKRARAVLKKGVAKEAELLKNQDRLATEGIGIEKSLHPSPSETVVLETARLWSVVSFEADEVYGYVAHQAKNLWNALGAELGLNYDELIELRHSELLSLLKSGKHCDAAFKKTLAKRYENSALVLENGKVALYEGTELKSYYTKERKADVDYSHIRELSGMAASPGVVRGKVALIKSINEIHKVKKGDVLVAANTMPAFVPAMEKASAVVTNEGGLLSHAAIVSREFGIPCVVGTKIATKVLKDGDLVEVDANRGIVKKIK